MTGAIADRSRAPVLTCAAEALVDLGAIAHNTELLADRARGELLAVVGADGFGHGAEPVARTAIAHGATWLGVSSLAEAQCLRAAGVTAPVLSWTHLPDEDFGPAIGADVDLSVPSLAHLAGVAACACRTGGQANVHLELDTGTASGGAPPAEWPELVAAARRYERSGLIVVRGVWSRLVAAHRPGHPTVAAQLRRFEEGLALARAAGLDPLLRHLANSAAIVALPDTHYDLARAGIGLYGFEPLPDDPVGLRPALTLRGRATLVKRVPPDTGVSAEHDYVTSADTTLIQVPLGFADGVPRLLSNQGEVAVNSVRCPVAGRVAMDQFVVDVGDLPVAVGDEVVLFGPGDDAEPTAVDWARWARTNPHEILTGVGGRVPRRYLPAGEEEWPNA